MWSTPTAATGNPTTGFTSTAGGNRRGPTITSTGRTSAFPPLVLVALRSVLDRARAGEQVEVGCLGGHGRTGTAVAWVRASYCQKAVETAAQEAFITGLRR
jgi:hypothetical protein